MQNDLETYLMEKILAAKKDFYIPYDNIDRPSGPEAAKDTRARIAVEIYKEILKNFCFTS